MTIIWLVIASAAKMLIYDISKKNQPAALIHTLTHPESKMKDNKLASDRPGQFFSSGAMHGAHVTGETPHELEYEHFATELAKFLIHEYDQKHFTALVIAADDHFYGLLAGHLSHAVKETIKQTIHKNYLSLPDTDLEQLVNRIKNGHF